jgi:hypothetical protein
LAGIESECPRFAITPATPTVLPIVLRNRSNRNVAFLFRLVGLSDDWVREASAGTVTLGPGESTRVEATVTLPAGFPACEHLAGLELQAVDPTRGAPIGPSTVQELTLLVGDTSTLEAWLEPEEPRGTRRGKLRVALRNRGREATSVGLSATSPDPGTKVAFSPRSVTLLPGEEAVVPASVRRRRNWFGAEERSAFMVRVQGWTTPIYLRGSLVQPAVFRRNAMRVLAVAAVLLLWIVGVGVGINKLAHRNNSGSGVPPGVTSAAGGAASGSGTGGAASGAGGSSTGGSAAGQGPSVSASALSNGRGVTSGQVTAQDPGSVTVTVQPTSLVAASALDPSVAGGTHAGLLTGALGGISKLAGLLGAASPYATTADQLAGSGDAATGVDPSDGPVTKQFGPSLLTAPQAVSPKRTTTTDAGGNWAFAGLPTPAYYLLTFTKPGYQTISQVVSVSSADKPVSVNVNLAAGEGAASGSVHGPSGLLGGVDLTITDGTNTYTTHTPSTGKDVGKWSMSGLSTPGTYLVTASRRGYGTATRLIKLGAGGSASGADLTLAPGSGTITGLVSAAGQPVGGVTVSLSGSDQTRTASTLTVAPIGTFTLPELPIPGTYTLTVSGDGWLTQTQQVQLKGNTNVALALSSATSTIHGTVTETGGGGLAGVGVTLTDQTNTLKTLTAAGGDYVLSGVPPGTYTLSFDHFENAPASQIVTIQPGEIVPAIDVALDPSPPQPPPPKGEVVGTVLSLATGKPIGDATISATLTDDHGQPVDDGCVWTATTNSAGAFDLKGAQVDASSTKTCASPLAGIPPGVLSVNAAATGFVDGTQKVSVGNTGPASAQFLLEPLGTLNGIIRNRALNGQAIAGATVTLTGTSRSASTGADCTSAPDPSTAGSFVVTCDPVTTDATGEYQYAQDLPSGSYTLTVKAAGFKTYEPPESTAFSINAGTTVAHDVTIDQLAALKVQVLTSTAGAAFTAASNAAVTVTAPSDINPPDSADPTCTYSPADPTVATCHTNSGGAALAQGLPDGSGATTVTATIPGYDLIGPAQIPVNLALNTTTTVTLHLRQTPTPTTGRVVWNRDGVMVGVPDATVTMSGMTVDPTQCPSGDCPPQAATFTATTDSTGAYTFPASGTDTAPTEATLNPITLSASHTDFTGNSIQGNFLYSSSVPAIALSARPGTLGGTVTFTPSISGDQAVTATVTSAPPGGSAVQVSVDPTSHAITATLGGSSAIPAGTYTVQFSAAHYSTASATAFVAPADDAALRPAGAASSLSPTMRKLNTITITAQSTTDPTAAPPTFSTLAGATCTLTDSAGHTTTATSDSSGSCPFPDLVDGTYTIAIAKAHYGSLSSSPLVSSTSISVSGGQAATPTLTLQQLGSVHGTLIAQVNGQTTNVLAGVPITLEDGSGATAGSTTTDGNGKFTFPDLLPGTYSLHVTLSGYTGPTKTDGSAASYSVTPSQLDVDAGQAVLSAKPATLVVTVTDPGGHALAGATVTISGPSFEQCTDGGTSNPSDCAVSGGVFTFTGLAPVGWSVTASVPNYQTLIRGVTLQPGSTQNLTMPLPLQVNTVKGTITAHFGAKTNQPLTGVSVTVTATGQGDSSHTGTATVHCPAASPDCTSIAFSISGLPNDTYSVAFSATGFDAATADNIPLTGSVVYQLAEDLAATAHTVHLSVSPGVGSDTIDSGTATLAADASSTGSTVSGATISSGAATFSANVYPGTYTAQVVDATNHYALTPDSGGHQVVAATTTFVVAPSDAASVNRSATLAEGRISVTATVLDGPSTNGSTSGVQITATGPGSGATTTGNFASGGSGTFTAYVAAGSWTVNASNGTGYTTVSPISASVTDGATTTKTAEFDKLGSVTVSPTYAAGVDSTAATVTLTGPGGTISPTSGTTYDDLTPGVSYTVTVTASGQGGASITATDTHTLAIGESYSSTPTVGASISVSVTPASTTVTDVTLTGPGGISVDVTNPTMPVVIGGLPVGSGYSVSVSGTDSSNNAVSGSKTNLTLVAGDSNNTSVAVH